MKTAGTVISVVGVLMLLSGINLAVTKYDLNSSHDVSKAFGGIGLSALILVTGLALRAKGKKNTGE